MRSARLLTGDGYWIVGRFMASALFAAVGLFLLLPGVASASPPSAITGAATEIGGTSATLNAEVNPGGTATQYIIVYGKTSAYGNQVPTPPASAGSGTSYVKVSQAITGLELGTTYHYNVVASNGVDLAFGTDKTFTTLSLPVVNSSQVTGINGAEVTLNGKVNPKGSATTYQFEYGPTTSYGTKVPVPAASAGSGSSQVSVSKTITGLTVGSTYHFRVVATNAAGTVKSSDLEFKAVEKPVATTGSADPEIKTATLKASINPKGTATTYQFEYGAYQTFGYKVPISPASVGSGTEAVEVSKEISGLASGGTYYYRVVATNYAGTTYGAEKSFNTKFPPKVTTGSADSNNLEAVLKGTINANGTLTGYYFEYGLTTAYGGKLPITPELIFSDYIDREFQETISGLEFGKTYHYRLVAKTETGEPITVYGEDKTFVALIDPIAKTGSASTGAGGITTAFLNGTVDPQGSVTTYQFEYGPTTSYGSKVPVVAESLGDGFGAWVLKKEITGLSTGTTYHYRIVASSPAGTSYGADKTFTTPKVPKVLVGTATGITSTGATLQAEVNPEGTATTYAFVYGETTSYGSFAPASPVSIGSGTSYVEVSQPIIGLKPATTYHYNVVALNASGLGMGTDKTFTTKP